MVDFVRPKSKLHLGQIVATAAALEALQQAGHSPIEFLHRHARGDWGELCDEDRELNDAAVECGSRILSAYRMKSGAKIWIITEAADDDGQRDATTILLPDEY